jgi:hypothetical protein
MPRSWQEHGNNMTLVWQHHGKLEAITWQTHDKNMARTWQDITMIFDLAMPLPWQERACQERGKNMARPWHEHGNIIMVIT